jgi:hypothetical protein
MTSPDLLTLLFAVVTNYYSACLARISLIWKEREINVKRVDGS